jgi:hypothetical protein
MPLPRIRIRTMMVAVGVVAIVIAGVIEARRLYRFSKYCEAIAVRADDAETTARHNAQHWARDGEYWSGRVRDAELKLKKYSNRPVLVDVFSKDLVYLEKLQANDAGYVAKSTRIAEHFARLKRKYERAARYPWLPVEPDPLEPE